MLWDAEMQRALTSNHKVRLNLCVLIIKLWIHITTGTSCKDTKGLILLLVRPQVEISCLCFPQYLQKNSAMLSLR